jgi:hypothetical protein
VQAFVSAYSSPKLGNGVEECEDAYSVVPCVGQDELIIAGPIVAAVADGASESILSGPWARTLVNSLTRVVHITPERLEDGHQFAETVRYAIDAWNDWLSAYLSSREFAGNPIRWYEKPKLSKGSHAATLVASFSNSNHRYRQWHACALGDVCLFQVRDETLIRSFPLEESGKFDTSPNLIGTKDINYELLARRVRLAEGEYRDGDQFFIGSDAFSAWFLSSVESGENPWSAVREFSSDPDPERFECWSSSLRSSGLMRNDDIAIVHVDMG